VKEFYEWFTKWFTEIHKTELAELKSLQEQWNAGIENPPTKG
jgi:hypothetical protein